VLLLFLLARLLLSELLQVRPLRLPPVPLLQVRLLPALLRLFVRLLLRLPLQALPSSTRPQSFRSCLCSLCAGRGLFGRMRGGSLSTCWIPFRGQCPASQRMQGQSR
jgi:hypothetical protein